MAFITAETRSDLIELSVAMLKQAPSAALLEELIALSVGGGSLADAADHIAKTDAFKAEYPSFQTAEQYAAEIFDNITTGGTVTADIRTAVIELATGMLTSGSVTKAGLALAIAEYLAAPAALLNTDFADIAQSFQNRADAAEYFVVTKELGGSTDAELAAAIASVTSDAATLTAANTAADATASAEAVVAGQTFTLTTGTDFISGTAGNDIINAVRGGSASDTETYSPTDQIDGGAGTDTLYIESDRTSENLATVTNVEKIQVTAAGAVLAVTLPNDKAYTHLENLNSTGDVSFNAIANATVDGGITSQPHGEITTYAYTATALLGATDNLDVELVGANGSLTVSGGTAANAMETITFNSLSDGEIDVLTVTNMNTTKLAFTGSGALNLRSIVDTGKTIKTYDASAATGAVTVTGVNATANTITGGAGNDTLGGAAGNDVITGGAGDDQITGGAGNDNLDGGAGDDTVILSAVTKDDVVKGGEGTDVLSLAEAVGYTAILNSGVGISGFETIKTTGALTQDFLGLAGNTITKAVTGSDSAVTLRGTAITSVDASTSGANGTLSISQATDGAADAMAVTLGSVLGVSNAQLTLNTVDTETMTVDSIGADGNTLTLGNMTAGKTATATAAAVAAAAATATDLTSVTITGSKNLTLTASSKNTALATVNADAFTGSTLSVTANSGTTQAAMTVTAPNTSATINTGAGADKVTVGDGGTAGTNNITTGDGADTIVSGAGADTIDSGDDGDSITSGAGDDSITSGDGADTITLGDGDDEVVTSGAGADVITGGAGNDTVTTAGAGADSIDGGEGNDTLSGGADNDTILGGAGDDELNGDAGNDSIVGGDGNDTITDGTGNDTVTGGDGVDTITISTGNDNVDAGAGNDVITITGLSAADTIIGGDGTDSLTVTNTSGATLAPTFTSIESLTVNTSSNFVLDLTDATDKTSLKTYTITSNGSATADNITLTNIASGSTVNLSDDSSWDGTSATDTDNNGDIGVVAIDMVAGGTLTLNVSANEDAATHVGTVFATSTTIGDASTVTINSKNSDSNNIVNNLTALILDATETQSVALVAEDSAGINTGNITSSTALQSLTLSSAAGAASVIGTVADATGLETLSITSTGASSSASIGDIAAAATTEAQLTSLTISASGTSTTTVQDIFSDQSSALTAVSITANGANSTVDLTADTGIDFGTGTIETLTITVADNSSLLFDAQSIISGAITTAWLTFGDYSTIADSGVNGEDLTITGAATTFNLSLGRGITNAAGDDIIVSGAITTLAMTTDLNDEAIALTSAHGLSYNGAVFGDFGTISKASYQHTGTGILNWDGTNIGSSTILGNTVTSTATSSTADTIIGGAGTDTLTGNIGDNIITGNAGADALTGGEGADTVDGGTGNDSLTLTEATAAADVAKLTNGGASTVEVAGVGNDTGTDTITGFDTANDTLVITATAVTNFVHGTDTGFRLGAGTAADGDALTDLAASAFYFDFNSDDTMNDSGVDMVVNMNSLKTSGVAYVTGTTGSDTAMEAKIQYVLTGTSAADTITGGGLDDTIIVALTTEGNSDVMTGGAGTDTLSLIGASHTFATDASLATIEIIENGGGANFDITVVLTGQTEAFAYTGTSGVDTVTVGTGTVTFTGGLTDTDVINASTGVASTVVTADATAITFTGSTAVDTFTNTGNGAVTFTGGGGIDVYTGSTTAVIDTLSLAGVTTAANADTFNGFTAGAGADIIQFSDALLAVDAGAYTAATAVTFSNLASIADAANEMIVDTIANLGALGVTIGDQTGNTNNVYQIAVASDTGAVFYDADGDWTSGSVQIATLVITGTLHVDNFVIIA